MAAATCSIGRCARALSWAPHASAGCTARRAHSAPAPGLALRSAFPRPGCPDQSTPMTAFGPARSLWNTRQFSFTACLKDEDKLPLNPFARFNQRRKEHKTAIDVYSECARHVENKELFVTGMGLIDAFETWYLLMVLHVWMISVRCRTGSGVLRRMSEDVSSTLCSDLEKRLYEGGITNFTVISRTLKELLDSYYGQILAYDEGLHGGDVLMASALWRNLFSVSGDVSTQQLQKAMRYVRRNLVHLDTMPDEEFRAGSWSFVV
ncbi:ubiquinol-cytochrome C chaperone-domain-containing protein [Hyaloraphidium curvatum]|nr:ubiquinol-cytochrome C chaperone-domain-containing protein [Hyaloraphidium curvatum]